MWSTSAGGHLMKVVNLTGFTVPQKLTDKMKVGTARVSREFLCRFKTTMADSDK